MRDSQVWVSRPLIASACCVLAAVLSNISYADVGVAEPEWLAPPLVYELRHQLSVPRAEDVRDTVRIGNFTSDGAVVEIVLIGNGGRLYGGTGEARKIRDDLYLLTADPIDHCSLLIHVSSSRIGIEGLRDSGNVQRFCPEKIRWLPAKPNPAVNLP